MYTSIVVPLDGTAFSKQALALAVALALRSRAALHLVHVQEPALHGGGAPFADTTLDNELHREERAELVLLATQVRQNTSLHVDATTVDGAGAAALGRYADTHRCDLVVMMSHGRGGFARAWMGSFADQLVRHTSVPLLLVHPGAEWPTDLDEPQFRHVLVPLDGSAFADDVLDHAISLATPGKTTFTLITVVVPPTALAYPDLSSQTFVDAAYVDTQREAAEAQLHARAAELRESGARVETLVLMHPRPAQAILDAADEHQADSIALSTHGRGGVERLVLGSVADELIRRAKVPVLVHRPELVGELRPGEAHADLARSHGRRAPG